MHACSAFIFFFFKTECGYTLESHRRLTESRNAHVEALKPHQASEKAHGWIQSGGGGGGGEGVQTAAPPPPPLVL